MMMKQARPSQRLSPAVRVLARLTALAVLTMMMGRASAQQPPPAPTPAPHAAQARMRTPLPTTIPHARPASGPQLGPQRGAPPKPTVVLKPGEVPDIKFDEPTWEFGRVKAGTDLTHEFVFKNTGTGPLEILEVKPG
jgi:hypothetical protein